jgi:phosphatidylglycerophosphatase A
VGYAPFAPGTAGSAVGCLLAVLAWHAGGTIGVGAVAGVVTLAGFATAGAAARRLGRTDPGAVVIDEVAGQMLALLFFAPSLPTLLIGFALFRLFDITKTWPARRLEALHGASGIMSDDLLAGVYANIAHHLLRWAVEGAG